MFKYIIFCVITVACAANTLVHNNTEIAAMELGFDLHELERKIFEGFLSRLFDFESDNELGSEIDDLNTRRKLIFPGTKWCGTGNIAVTDQDLGSLSETDACCRAHDKCPDSIPSGETKFGLKNDGWFTRVAKHPERSSCECDNAFRDCLYLVAGIAATTMGNIYFNTLAPKCHKQGLPITGCIKESGGKCKDYSVDIHGELSYQWVDTTDY